ncbi:diguanylate cyclase [Ectothiorhodospiraceae bacterium WFHF3C12]|nr:diguanylate cyclase [Ectothiorhodospiraceae bacterium WFHF3C12]
MAETEINPRYQLSLWTAEFIDPLTERRYRQYVEPTVARYLRNALLIWASLWMAFALTDLYQFGLSETFVEALVVRGILAGLIALGGALVSRRPRLATAGVVVTPLEALGFTLFFLFYFVTPAEDIPWIVGLTMVMIIGLFVLLPNRLVLSAGVAVYAMAGTLLSVAAVTPDTTWSGMTVLALILMVPVVSGLFAAYRFEAVRRREFAALERAQAEIEQRRALEKELQRQAATDPLTGACNRREYERRFEQEVHRARRHDRPLAICVLDLDHFKHVNDTYGHNAGDAALVLTADICRAELRESDILGRLGGEEFVVILPETTAAAAAHVAERLRVQLERTDVVASQQRFRLTATFGVTQLAEGDRSINDLVLRADEALYEGKRTGRNQVRAA